MRNNLVYIWILNYVRALAFSFIPIGLKELPIYNSTLFAISYLILNFLLGYLPQIITTIIQHPYSKLLLPYSGQLLALLLLGISIAGGINLILYVLAKILGGKGGFGESFRGVCFSSTPLLFISIPIDSIYVILHFLIIYLLITNFYIIHRYNLLNAMINVILPVLVYGLIIVGIF